MRQLFKMKCAVLLIGKLLAISGFAFGVSHDVAVQIIPQFNSVPLDSGQQSFTNSANQKFSITRLDFLLSDFSLRRADGTWFAETNSQAFISVEQNRTSFRLEKIPMGQYDRIRFHVGLRSELNHSNPAQYPGNHPLNPNLNGLHWGWSGGYVFFAIEGLWQNEKNESRGFSFHLGNDPMLMTVELPIGLTMENGESFKLSLDLEKILTQKFSEENSSTHSRTGDQFAESHRKNIEQSFSILSERRAPQVSSFSKKDENYLGLAERVPPNAFPKTTPYRFTFSAQFPIPDLPRDNPLTEEGVALGRKLFSEKLLSKNNAQSCDSCHQAESAFAEAGKQFSVGAEGREGNRNAMPIFNMAWKKSFFWDGRAPSLREQVLMPIQNEVEMHENLENVVAKLSRAENYPALFEKAFGNSEISSNRIAMALEQFVFTLTSFNSKFDRAMEGKESLTDEEKRGFELFITEYDPRRGQFGADCFHCHGGPFFTTHGFANNGLDATFADPGRAIFTGKETDKGKFAVPSLRNVEVTGPYMHDGRFKSLEEVIDHYSNGVKPSSTLDPNLAKHPINGISLSHADKKALVAFLKTLTDEPLQQRGKVALAQSGH